MQRNGNRQNGPKLQNFKCNAFVVIRLDISYHFQVFLFEMSDVERNENSLLRV